MSAFVAGVPLPPQELIFGDPSAERGLVSGRGFLRRIEALSINYRVGLFFDVGCGWGRLAYTLLFHNFSQHYVGVDIVKRRIDFLRETITPVHPNFEFYHIDVRSGRYNKYGKEGAEGFSAKSLLGNARAHTITAISVFTHMYEDDIRHYLKEIWSVMTPESRFVFTAFIMDKKAEAAIREGKCRWTMKYAIGESCRYEDPQDPLFAIAYKDSLIQKAVNDAGLKAKYELGTWSLEKEHPTHDWILAKLA